MGLRVAVVDYGMGNLGSILNMLRKVGAEAIATSDAEAIRRAPKLILPGVGAFDSGMKNLAGRGLIPALRARVMGDGTPVLGVCLGMQLLSRRSEEGQCEGLGWLEANTVRFRVDQTHALKVPHMGWNTVGLCRPHPLWADLEVGSRFYFVHGYHVVCTQEQDVLAHASYGIQFAAAVASGNVLGVQFHPEKSHKFGMQMLKNFVERV